MAEQTNEEASKKKAKAKPKEEVSKTSIKSYKEGVELEKQKMDAYAKKFGSSVTSLQADIRKHSKDISAAAEDMRTEGIKNMSNKIGKFKKDIQSHKKELEAAAEHMADNVKYFISEINKKKKEFKEYIKNFQG
ncbi:MAG: hypothetical protein Q8N55_00525 [bacterium]|nr:hypothetical protein [bacterium]